MVARVDVLELINYLFFYFRASLRLVIPVTPVIPAFRPPLAAKMNPFGRTVSLGTECCLADVDIVSPMVARVDVLELINYLFFYFRASLRLVILVIPVIPVIRPPQPQK